MKRLILLPLMALALCSAHAAVVLSDTFAYSDGAIVRYGSPWSSYSGTAGSMLVSNSMLVVSGSRTEDVSAPLAGAPYLESDPNAKLYSCFKMVLSNNLPSLSGTYIADFRGTNTGAATDFGARIFLLTTNMVNPATGVAAGKFRVHVSNGSLGLTDNAAGQFDQDLSTNVVYTIVTRFTPSTGVATLWVNPNSESDPCATATDVGSAARPNPFSVFTYAFRQASGSGTVYVDDLKIATSFGDVVETQIPVFTPVWNVAAGAYPDLPTAGNNVRGVAINPVTTNVIFASTTQGTNNGANHVTVLDGTNNGALIAQLSGSGVGGGTLNLMAVRVSDDGSVYACNMSGASSSNFKLYRWASETNITDAPLVVFNSGAGTSFQYRVGDWMDVRGSGTNTELVVCGSTTSGANISTNFLIFRPTNDALTVFTNISISFPNFVARGSHGIAFEGINNALYAKMSGSQTVTRIAYNPDILTAQVTASFNLDQSASPGLDYAEINGVKLLSAVCAATTAITNGIQHKVKVFQLTSASNYVIVLDKYLPFPFFANGNGTGMTDMRGGRLVASELNNGISFYSIHMVTHGAPTIADSGQPVGGSVVEGSDYTLWASVNGFEPLHYQWYFNGGSPIADATNNSYTLQGIDLSAAGSYHVVVTNEAGRAVSAIAILQVIPPNAPSIRVNGQLAVGTIPSLNPGTVQISGGYPGGMVFYTVDGSEPSFASIVYSGEFQVLDTTVIRAMSLSSDFSGTAFAPPVTVAIIPTYNLTTSVGGLGSIGITPGVGPYGSNSVVTLTASGSTNWVFDHWTGDLTGNANPANLTMNGARTVQAVFVPSAYPLTIGTPGGGGVTANGQSISQGTYYPVGSSVSVQGVPSTGWSFVRWQGTEVGVANPISISMYQTQNVEAVFGTVVVTNVAGHGHLVMSTPNPVAFGTSLTLDAVPDPGYYFVGWSGAFTGTNSPRSLTVSTASPVVGALFAMRPAPTITGQPVDGIAFPGSNFTFTVVATGSATLKYQWRKNGSSVVGATSQILNFNGVSTNDEGAYDVVVTNNYGSATSALATLSVAVSPYITGQPEDLFLRQGTKAIFSVGVSGSDPLSYQWRKDAVPLISQTNSSLTLNTLTASDVGSYDVVVSNRYGSVTSRLAHLAVDKPQVGESYQATVLSQGPVGYWRFGVSQRTLPTSAVAYNQGSLGYLGNGTYEGSQVSFREIAGALANGTTAAHFDGGSQGVAVMYSETLRPAVFTVEAWVNADLELAGSTINCVLSFLHSGSPRSGWLIYQSAGQGYNLRMYNENGTSTSASLNTMSAGVAGKWVHLVATFDGVSTKLYSNGVLAAVGSPTSYVPAVDGSFTIGMRSDGSFRWAGKVDEVAYYDTVLNEADITAHYAAASTNADGYPDLIKARNPMVYLRLNEPSGTTADNSGLLGASGDGSYVGGCLPGEVGLRSPTYSGLESDNLAVALDGSGSGVMVPSLGFATNAVTICGWVKASGQQAAGAGLVLARSGSSVSGLTLDNLHGGLGLAYNWGGESGAYNWSPSIDSGLPLLPDAQWAYVALVVEPERASIYVCDRGNLGSFTGVTNVIAHGVQGFDGSVMIGADPMNGIRNFKGMMDEVAVFDRALGVGELYTQIGAAVGGVPARIFKQPKASDSVVYDGDPVRFDVDAGGSPGLAYQWRKDGASIAGATSSAYAKLNAQVADDGAYDCVVSNAYGTVTSGVAVLAVKNPLRISVQPASTEVVQGNSAMFGVVVEGAQPIVYQWRRDGLVIAGATQSTLGLSGVSPSDVGGYDVVVENSHGMVTSVVAMLVVKIPPYITMQPTGTNVQLGGTAGFSIYAGGTEPLTCQWYRDGVVLTGRTGSNLTLINVTTNDVGSYTVLVTNAWGTATSTPAFLTVRVPPFITTPPVSLSVAEMRPASFSVSAGGSGALSYQWRKGGVPISGATSSTFGLAEAVLGDAGSYDVVVGSDYGTVTSAVAILTVRPATWISVQNSVGTPGGTVTVPIRMVGRDLENGVGLSLNYDPAVLCYQSVQLGAASAGGYLLLNTGSTNLGRLGIGLAMASGTRIAAGTQDVFRVTFRSAVHTNETGTSLTLGDLPVSRELVDDRGLSLDACWVDGSVHFQPAVVVQPVSQVVTQRGDSLGFVVGISGTYPLSCQWWKDGESLAGQTNVALAIGAASLTDAGNYTAVVTNLYGSVTSLVAVASTHFTPLISGEPQSLAVMEGGVAAFSVAAGGSQPLGYQWLRDGGAIAGATTSELTMNGVTSHEAGGYEVVVANAFGSVTSVVATLTVNVPPFISAQPQNTSVSAGGSGGFSVSAGGSQPLACQWSKDGVVLAGRTGFTLDLSNVSTNDGGTYSAVVTNAYGLVTSAGAVLTVNVPAYIANQPAPLSVMEGSSAQFSVVAGGTSPLSYQWRKDGVIIAGATISSLTISGVTTNDAAGYDVVVANAYGEATSATATLSVTTAPFITDQPLGGIVLAGGRTGLTVGAGGTAPLACQWRKDGVVLTGQTGFTLAFSRVTTNDNGGYDAVVTNSYGSATSVVATLVVPWAKLALTASTQMAGVPFTVPIHIDAVGNENAVGLSLKYDPTRLQFVSAAVGSNLTGASVLVNTTSTNVGKIGLGISLPSGVTLTPGAQELMRVVFIPPVSTNWVSTALSFGDVPVVRQVVDLTAVEQPASYGSAVVSLTPAEYEGDVVPRGVVDGVVRIADWVQVGRFVAALDLVTNAAEFQAADCAPRSVQGDGRLTVTDWVQAGRYAVGLDPSMLIGGPKTANVGPSKKFLEPMGGGRVLRIISQSVVPGESVTVQVQLEGQGDENALGFSVGYDASRLTLKRVTLGSGAAGATVNVNTNTTGRVSMAILFEGGGTFRLGQQEVALLEFATGIGFEGSSALSFGDMPVWREVSSTQAESLATAYESGAISANGGVPTLEISTSGSVIKLSWPLGQSTYVLEKTPGVASGAWSGVTGQRSTNASTVSVTVPLENAPAFFRLRRN